jgi:hypothetical protein
MHIDKDTNQGLMNKNITEQKQTPMLISCIYNSVSNNIYPIFSYSLKNSKMMVEASDSERSNSKS